MENTGVPADPPPNPYEPHQPYPPQPYPPQPPAVPPYGSPYPYAGPQPGWPAPPQPYLPPPPQRISKWLVPTIVLFAVVVLGCVAGAGYLVVRGADRAATTTADPEHPGLDGLDGAGSSATGVPEDNETIPAGPRAATYPVREDDDLGRVCDQWYYPQSPKYAGAAAHQISVGIVSDRDLKTRSVHPLFDIPYGLGSSVEKAWRAEKPAKSQLMACVDLVTVGGQLKKCTYDDPKPDTLSLRRGTYQLRLFEVATGRKLLDKKLTGEDEACPSLVFVGDDKTIYSKPADRQFYELLRPYVVKKL
jgi:hypothetical protein